VSPRDPGAGGRRVRIVSLVVVLLAVPNVSEGRDPEVLDAIADAFASGARVLDRHADADHHRAVYSLAGAPGTLSQGLVAGAQEAVARIDLRAPRGQHPHIGAIDVVPLVHVSDAERGAACAEALLTADRLGGELRLPVFLYGALAGGRTRAELRRGGIANLAARIADEELTPDYGPRRLHPSAGAVLVCARPPLVAFNLELAAPAHLGTAREIAESIREGGREGLPGLRAIAIELVSRQRTAQVSMNVEDPLALPLAAIVDAVSRHADIAAAEIVGLTPRAALAGFPAELELRGFDPARQIIENHLD
jgi:glutamate formiminotransferase/glutamate formiminotransferase/formiminotetrahydrofolate cyclodeaminase